MAFLDGDFVRFVRDCLGSPSPGEWVVKIDVEIKFGQGSIPVANVNLLAEAGSSCRGDRDMGNIENKDRFHPGDSEWLTNIHSIILGWHHSKKQLVTSLLNYTPSCSSSRNSAMLSSR